MLCFVAALLAVTLSAVSVRAAAGGGVRGYRRLASTADGSVPGFHRLPGSGVCSTSQFSRLPSYDAIKLLPFANADGREKCERLCKSVNCPAFNYAKAGLYYFGSWFLRVRVNPLCIVYHDRSTPVKVPSTVGTLVYRFKSTSAFHVNPTKTTWFFRDWEWSNGECYVADWRKDMADFWGNPPADNVLVSKVKLPRGMGYASQNVADWVQCHLAKDNANQETRIRSRGATILKVAVGIGSPDDDDFIIEHGPQWRDLC